MALRDALWIEGAGAVYNAGEYRRGLLDGLVANAGVAAAGDFAVTEQSPTAVGVRVAAGIAYVDGTENATTQGRYAFINDASVNVALAALPGGGTFRYDRVGLRVRDSEFSGGTDAGDIFVVTGTASGSPSEPAVPNNFLELARVTVDSTGNIVNADILDRRPRATGLGGTVLATSTSRPLTPFVGMRIYETDTALELVYYGGSTGWAKPWGEPWGQIAYAERTTTVGGFGNADTPVPGLVVSPTLVANRKIKVTLDFMWSNANVGNFCLWYVFKDAVKLHQRQTIPTHTNLYPEHTEVIDAPTAGVHTYQMYVNAQVGPMAIYGDVTVVSYIRIEDVGPNGVPA